MNRQRALSILGALAINQSLVRGGPTFRLTYSPGNLVDGAHVATLEGHFNADQLEALAWWMRTGGQDEEQLYCILLNDAGEIVEVYPHGEPSGTYNPHASTVHYVNGRNAAHAVQCFRSLTGRPASGS